MLSMLGADCVGKGAEGGAGGGGWKGLRRGKGFKGSEKEK